MIKFTTAAKARPNAQISFLPNLRTNLPMIGKNQCHRYISTNGHKTVKSRLLIEVQEEVVVSRLCVHLECDQKHGYQTQKNERRVLKKIPNGTEYMHTFLLLLWRNCDTFLYISKM